VPDAAEAERAPDARDDIVRRRPCRLVDDEDAADFSFQLPAPSFQRI
jgi:hypothetical protein